MVLSALQARLCHRKFRLRRVASMAESEPRQLAVPDHAGAAGEAAFYQGRTLQLTACRSQHDHREHQCKAQQMHPTPKHCLLDGLSIIFLAL